MKIRKIKSFSFFDSKFEFNINRHKHSSEEFSHGQRYQREFWKIIYVLEGKGKEMINDNVFPVRAGSIFLIHPEDRTMYTIDSDFIDIVNILFTPNLLGDNLPALNDDFNFFCIFHQNFYDEVPRQHRSLLYALDSDKKIYNIIRKLEKEFDTQGPNYKGMIKAEIMELLISMSRLSIKKFNKQRKRNIINYIDHIIDKHYTDDFDLSYLASKVNLHKSYLCRIYQHETGTTIVKTLKNRRIKEAKEMLKNSSKNISEICYESGFNDLSYFYRAFHAATSINPGDFRKKYGQN